MTDLSVGFRLGGRQHGVSIQISINLGKKFFRISSIRKIAVTSVNLGERVCIFTFFLFSDSGLYLLKSFDFYFYLFRNGVTLKTSNRQSLTKLSVQVLFRWNDLKVTLFLPLPLIK